MASKVDNQSAKDEEYIFSAHNQSDEVLRMARQHRVFYNYLDGKLVQAPLDLTKSGLRVLDAGCTDGLWLRAILPKLNSPSLLLGVDNTPRFFPPSNPAPIKLLDHNVNNEWDPQWASSFDLVHQRMVLPAAGPTVESARKVIRGYIDQVKPGGWLQIVESIRFEPTGPAVTDVYEVLCKAMPKVGVGIHHAENVKGWLIDERMEEVQESFWHLPVGRKIEDDQLSKDSADGFVNGCEAVSRFARNLDIGYSAEYLDDLVARADQEIRTQGGLHSFSCVIGRKKM